MTVPATPQRPGLDRLTVALVALSALFVALFEVLLIPLYVGSVFVPVAVVLAVAGNVLLPRWAYSAVPSGGAATLPFVAWLVPVLVLPLFPRPEGDVLVVGGGAQQYAFYGVVLLGTIAGFVTILKLTARTRPAPSPPRGRPGGP